MYNESACYVIKSVMPPDVHALLGVLSAVVLFVHLDMSPSRTISNRRLYISKHLLERAGRSLFVASVQIESSLWVRPAACNIHPFGKAGSFLAFHVDDVSVAPTPAANTPFLRGVPVFPVVVLLEACTIVERRLF